MFKCTHGWPYDTPQRTLDKPFCSCEDTLILWTQQSAAMPPDLISPLSFLFFLCVCVFLSLYVVCVGGVGVHVHVSVCMCVWYLYTSMESWSSHWVSALTILNLLSQGLSLTLEFTDSS